MEIKCPSCTSGFIVEVHNNNETFCCPDCGKSFILHGNKSFLAAKVVGISGNCLKVACPGCRQHYDIEQNNCNRPFSCQVCNKEFIVPETRSAPPPQPRKTAKIEKPLPGEVKNFRDVTNEMKMSEPKQAVSFKKDIHYKKEKPWVIRALWDFMDFKVMIIPIILRWLWLASALIGMVWGIVVIAQGIDDDSFMDVLKGVVLVLFFPFGTHMLFELLIIFFAILDILREIRDKINTNLKN